MRSCWLVFILLVALVSGTMALEQVERGPGSRHFLEGGVLLGSETDIHSYLESPIRAFVETGISLRPLNSRGNNLGLSLGMSSGHEDQRFYLAPHFSRQVGDNWRIVTSGGILWSNHDSPMSSDFFETGQHWRIALKRNSRFSLCYVYEQMDYRIDGGAHDNYAGSFSSNYVGITLEKEPPSLISFAVAATLATYWFRQMATHWIAEAK